MKRGRVRVALPFAVSALVLLSPAQGRERAWPERVQAVRAYIKAGWTTLTRSTADLPEAARDPKLRLARRAALSGLPVGARGPGARGARAPAGPRPRALRARSSCACCPRTGARSASTGCSTCRGPTWCPGGRFNEMYGWDSYFIQVGLLRDGELERARDMVENFLYEIEHYGTILNANRTLLPHPLAAAVPDADGARACSRRRGTGAGCARTLPAIEAYYRFWTTEPHLVPGLGLSRYYDLGEGPAPEVVSDERDAAGPHALRPRRASTTARTRSRDYDVAATTTAGRPPDDALLQGRPLDARVGLRPLGSLRPLQRGRHPLRARVPERAPLPDGGGRGADRRTRSGNARAPRDAGASGRRRAAAAIDRYLWDAEAGLYFDYNFETKRRRPYEFATTFYPLWVGLRLPGAGRARARQPGAASRRRAASSPAPRHRQPVGRAVRLGARCR